MSDKARQAARPVRGLQEIVPGRAGDRPTRRAHGLIKAMRLLDKPFYWISYRGHARLTSLLARYLAGAPVLVRSLTPTTKFSFPLDDTYWNFLASTSRAYEPEIADVLRLIKEKDYSFLDCGANFGYWSCLASDPEFGGHPALAIEPSSLTFQRLTANWELNGRRFHTERCAISSRDGEVVRLGGASHAARSILADEGEEVTTRTLDSLVESYGLKPPYVIKLDVEGVEVAAMGGAQSILATSPLILYEDHGSDRTHHVTEYFLAGGWRVLALDAGGMKEITSVAQADEFKKSRRIGYNFAALRPGSAWLV